MTEGQYVHSDMCIGFWADAWNAGVVEFPPGARVLEIGSAEADWVTDMKAIRPDLHITTVDWRPVERPSDLHICGDILAQDFGSDAFDAIVAVSTIEHIGLGSYDDPIDPDGDTHCIEKCLSWLKPGGWLYLDVPYRPDRDVRGYHTTSNYRGYDDAAVYDRLIRPWLGLVRYSRVYTTDHADGPYMALVLEKT